MTDMIPMTSSGTYTAGVGGNGGGGGSSRLPRSTTVTLETRAKYNAAELEALGKKGQAFKNADGSYSYPIADGEDLSNAIHAVGRGNADHNALRRYIMGRAKALGMSDQIPDNWASDGSISGGDSMGRSAMIGQSVLRQVDFLAEPSDGNTLEGYAAVFNQPAMIDSRNEGTFRERMLPGAFSKTISERKPVMMFDHGQHPMVGSIPIGAIQDLREDSNGLYVKAQLADNWLVEPVRDAIKNGSISGMSIRMSVLKDDWTVGEDRTSERSVTEVALAELGPVVFPAYEGTSVSARSREVITSLADPEIRSELARIFASGVALSPVDEPPSGHSNEQDQHIKHINQLRRRARRALII